MLTTRKAIGEGHILTTDPRVEGQISDKNFCPFEETSQGS